MAAATFLAYLSGLGVAFGIRTLIHYRRTGRTGFNGITGTPRDASWWGGVLFVVAIVVGIAGPGFAAIGVIRSHSSTPVAMFGLVVAALGLAGTVVAQSAMGDQWRIGVDASETTELVTTGMFAGVRNPIFSAMILAQTGITIAVLNVVGVVALVTLIVAIEIQVRLVEEPFLGRVHGDRYAQYRAVSGRFVPRWSQTRSSRHEPTRSTQ